MRLFSSGQAAFCVRNTGSDTLVDWEQGSPNLNAITLAEELSGSTGLCITGTDAITAFIDPGSRPRTGLADPPSPAHPRRLALTSRLTTIGYAGIAV